MFLDIPLTGLTPLTLTMEAVDGAQGQVIISSRHYSFGRIAGLPHVEKFSGYLNSAIRLQFVFDWLVGATPRFRITLKSDERTLLDLTLDTVEGRARSELPDIELRFLSLRSNSDAPKFSIRGDYNTRNSAENFQPNITNPIRDAPSRMFERQPDIKATEEFPVWFGTNRELVEERGAQAHFSSARGKSVRYGRCDVRIPKAHRIGSIGSRWIKRLISGQDDRLTLSRIASMERDDFWSQVAAQIAAQSPNRRHAMVFLHGYNVSFLEAALRAAQIGFDLSIEGAMGFFSWPSKATIKGYLADEASIEYSEKHITEFLVDFATRTGATSVNIIAHSMGNRGLLRAVDRIMRSAEDMSRVRFDQIILAAADVDTQTFGQFCDAYQALANRTTMYVSDMDRAIATSQWLHDFPRVGITPPINVFTDIDTIRVRRMPLTLLGHGYVAEARDVLADIHQLITRKLEPDHRFGLNALTNEHGQRYWAIKG